MWVTENFLTHSDRSEKSVINIDRAARSTRMTEFSAPPRNGRDGKFRHPRISSGTIYVNDGISRSIYVDDGIFRHPWRDAT
jgi:hypothetical protein